VADVPCPRLQKILQRVGRPQPVVIKVVRRFCFITNSEAEISWTVDPGNTKGGRGLYYKTPWMCNVRIIAKLRSILLLLLIVTFIELDKHTITTKSLIREYLRGRYHCTVDLLFD
jgi:hypothetical protein